MNRINFIPDAMAPSALGLYLRDSTAKRIKDIVLSNPYATQYGVSEMRLNVSKCSAVDESGTEHFLADFSDQKMLTLCGMPSARIIRSRSFVKLKPGVYTRIKFHLEEGGFFIFRDRREMPLSDYNSIEFEIEGNLKIQGDESPGFILRFDFPPFKTASAFLPIVKTFRYLNQVRSKVSERVFQ